MRRFFRAQLVLPTGVLALMIIWVYCLPAIASSALPMTVAIRTGPQTQTTTGYISCLGARAIIKRRYEPIVHVTAAAALGVSQSRFALPYHVIGSETGSVEIDPLDSQLPTYTGRFASWVSDSSDRRGFFAHADTFTIVAKGSDGSTLIFDETLHIAMDAEGNLTTTFDGPTCQGLSARTR